MGLIDAFKKLHNWGMDVGVSLIVKAPLENAWALMLSECIQQGYWIIETDQGARTFAYLVPMELKAFKGGQKISVYVSSLGQQACAVSITADAYEGENNAAPSELFSKGRQRELIGWLIGKIESRFAIACRSATPNTPHNLPTSTPAAQASTRPQNSAPSQRSPGPSFDFLN